jgi:glycosyltransferase involved in cell wall biosynthesis
MRIGIDARMMGAGKTRGIGRYIEELVGALLATAPEHRYVLVVRDARHPFADHPSVETVVADVPWYGVAEQLRMPGILAGLKADIVHIPHWNVPLAFRGRFVVTVHDLLLRTFPESAKASTRSLPVRWAKRAAYRVVSGSAIRRASAVLVPTRAVADDVRNLFPSAAERVIVGGEGMPVPDAAPSPPADPPYLLYVGSAYPHKRLGALLRAWPSVRTEIPGLALHVVGERDAFMERLVHGAGDGVRFLGRLDDAALADAYRGALAFVYPTAAEGFGLPPLEALARGCPVVAADLPVLREVLGDAPAAWLGPEAEWRDAIIVASRTVRDDSAARSRALASARGLAERHDWRHAARTALAAYAAVARTRVG